MSREELRRAQVLGLVESGQLSHAEAAKALSVSRRHLRRLLDAYRESGAEGLRHGNRGRPAHNRLDADKRARIVALARDKYAGFNDCHLAQLLEEREEISIGRETLRAVLRNAGVGPKRRRRPPRHHHRREPSAARGQLVQWDGSEHRWFGTDRPQCTLMAAVDDADGRPIHAFFHPAETSVAYFLLLDGVLRKRGAPRHLYHDGHGALVRTDGHWTIEEQLANKQTPPHVGQALEELGIHQIRSYCPEGRGRIERFFGTAQDRLVAELRLLGITSIDDANRYLVDTWIPDYSNRFGFSPTSKESLYRPTSPATRRKTLSFRYQRVVSKDNTVTLGQLLIHIPPGPGKRGYAKAKVEARQHLDGTWTVYHHELPIATHPSTPVADPERFKIKNRNRQRRDPADVLVAYFPETDVRGPKP